MNSKEACALLGIDDNAFYRLVRRGRVTVLKQGRKGESYDYSGEDVLALVDDEEVISLRERALRYGDEESQPPIVRAKRATISTESVSEAYSRFIKAVTDACFNHRLTRAEAEARMPDLLSALWDSTEAITDKLPNPGGGRFKPGAGPGERKKARQRQGVNAFCARAAAGG